jgi:predicted methyltransferase
MILTRRLMMTSVAALALAGCGNKKDAAPKVSAKAAPPSLEKVIAGEWRSAADRARDQYRHPQQSLEFWGVKPGVTVVEFWPGAGWYTDILAPFLEATRG